MVCSAALYPVSSVDASDSPESLLPYPNPNLPENLTCSNRLFYPPLLQTTNPACATPIHHNASGGWSPGPNDPAVPPGWWDDLSTSRFAVGISPPKNSGASQMIDFEAFLRPLALETGLTDPAEIHATLGEVRRLLERLRAHPLYAEIDAAERHHEVPYYMPGDTGIIDLLYHTEAGWFLVDFKTDELRSEGEARVVIQRDGYDRQVERYAEAAASRLGVRAKMRLVFLNVNNNLSIFDL